MGVIMEYLNFNEICGKVSFKQALDMLEYPYTETDTELRGEGFIISRKDGKEVYFNPLDKNEKGGSVIQFVANKKDMGLREAAKILKDAFMTKEKPGPEPSRPIPILELEYTSFLEVYASREICQELNVGLCTSRSIMAGRICFKIGQHYVGYSIEKEDWLFPKGFQRKTLWNYENCNVANGLLLVTKDLFKALKVAGMGYKGIVASIYGNSPTQEQMEIIQKYEIVLIG